MFPAPTQNSEVAVSHGGGPQVDTQAVGVCRKVRQRFEECPYRALRRLSASCEFGVLTLHGSVGTYYMKQLAQSIAQQVDGVHSIVNQVEVVRHD
jgi:osmotically-inducible protein OsmY